MDRGKIVLDKTKDNLTQIKEFNRDTNENAINYAEDNIANISGNVGNKGMRKFNEVGQKSIVETKNNIIKSNAMLDKYKKKLAEKRTANFR